ncbi:MAG: low molecular weight phosphotyrosine protein phosphatase [Bacteroidetes bacterium]|nr:MAG: low molecular weight phosphotyrosine protein phosphatase [Bacteroidota bacterium]
MKILFVCLGNICRSPLADGILRKKVTESGLDAEVDSAGTAGYHIGEAPDPRMIQTAKNRGTDISFLRARQFSQGDFDAFDRIYVMDHSNYGNVVRLARNQADEQKVSLVLELLGTDSEVPDPYYGGQSGFDHVYDLLDEATDKIMESLH